MLELKVGQMYKFMEGTDRIIFLEENKESYIFWSYGEGKFLPFFRFVILDFLKNNWLSEVND